MADASPRYGAINQELIGRWLGLAPEEDGPFWALNLMKYRPVAAYRDGRESAATGREADDAYAPVAPLKAIGAAVALHGDVERQSGAEPQWDRVGIVRYPSRAAFFEMQRRDDFKRQHEHKDAGMEFTIVMACLPDRSLPPTDAPVGGSLVLRVARTADVADVLDAERIAAFDVEGVIVGDERTWTHVVFDRSPSTATTDALLASAAAAVGVEEQFALVIAPAIDRLVSSLLEAGTS